MSFEIKGYQNDKTFRLEDVRTVQDLKLPAQTLDIDTISKNTNVSQLQNIQSYFNERPKLLLGQNYGQLLTSKKLLNVLSPVPYCQKQR